MTLFDEAQIAFLALSVSLSLLNTWRLKKRNISVWVLARGEQNKATKAVEISYLIGLVTWIALILLLATGGGDQLPRFLGRSLFDSTILKITALPLLFLSLALHFLGLQALGPHWRVGTSAVQPGNLVTTGIYAFSRNPIMLGLILYALAVWLTYSTPALLVVLFLAVGTVHYQITREEAFLLEQHGSRYMGYCKNVGRYLTTR